MEKITRWQKKIIISKLKEMGANPQLLSKYEKDGEEGVDDKEWEKARREVLREALLKEDVPLFSVAPLLSQSIQKSPILIWMCDNRKNIAVTCIALGVVMIATDPGALAQRAVATFRWNDSGLWEGFTTIGTWLNWTSSGWAGLVSIIFGSIWGGLAARFFR
ncbi:hypothetical protein MNBD_NITROSPINAE02-2051 [hydrothermal vent metagenome]|uniref:Uncharacterized protein n=1 Tax=hydrothermal vent metagenome TaxID=652676 RepID=A0A3B1CR67_9ZZZZ